MDTFVIVGAGQVAAQCIATLRTEGFEGEIVLVGDEPSVPYHRPPLSKKVLAGEMTADKLAIRPPAFYEEKKVSLRLGARATGIDRASRTVALADGGVVRYDRLLLATGARSRHLDVPGANLSTVATLRTIADEDALRPRLVAGKRLVLVGGGYIGLEVAGVATKLGCHVTVVEREDRVMRRVVSERVSAFFDAEHRKAGATIRLGADVSALDGDGAVIGVHVGNGTILSADVVLVCAGAVPDTSLAESAGLDCNDGIVVDQGLRTSDPLIFAGGDCARQPNAWFGGPTRLESVPSALEQGKHAALSMLDRPLPPQDVPWFWSDQLDLKLQIAGNPATADATVVRGDPEKRSFSVFHLRGGLDAGHVVAIESIAALQDFAAGRKLIASRNPIAAARLADLSILPKDLV